MQDIREQVTRQIVIHTGRAEVWHALTDEQALVEWLDEPSARVVLEARTDERLTWMWWPDDEADGPSTVTFELTELDDGATRVTVTEERVGAARACLVGDATVDLWSDRLVGLEVRCLARRPAAV